MRIIRAPTLARAHELAVRTVLEKGWVLETENEEATIECDELALEVAAPESAPMVSPASRFQQRFLDAYAENLLRGSDAKFEYDYHRRLFDWGERLSAEGKDVHVDQVDYIARKLTEAPTTRRAVAITWNPVVDKPDVFVLSSSACCGTGDEGRLPSNDILSAGQTYARSHLQKAIAGGSAARAHIALVPTYYSGTTISNRSANQARDQHPEVCRPREVPGHPAIPGRQFVRLTNNI